MIKIGNKKVNKIMIDNKEVLKVIMGNNTSSGIAKYIKRSPTNYNAVISAYNGSSSQQIIEIYDITENLIATSDPIESLVADSTGVWKYNLTIISSAIIQTLNNAGIQSSNIDYSNSNGYLNMVYSKSGTALNLVYFRVSDSNSKVYSTRTFFAATTTDITTEILLSSYSGNANLLYIGGYTSTSYTTGSSYFTLNTSSTTLRFGFDIVE